MRRRVLFVTVLAAVMAVMAVGTASAAIVKTVPDATFPYSNGECLYCHEDATRVDVDGSYVDTFTGPLPVDRNTACKKCHRAELLNSHPEHNWDVACGSVCHEAWNQPGEPAARALIWAIPTWADARGSFSTSRSVDASPALLHMIHSTPRWPGMADSPDSRCGSCHAVAACQSCHTQPAKPKHATHAPQFPLWNGKVSLGLLDAEQVDTTRLSAESTAAACYRSDCHDIGTQGSFEATRHEDLPGLGGSAVQLLGNTASWRKRGSGVYTAARMSYSNDPGSSMRLAFRGEQVVLVSDQDPYRGEATVTIESTSGMIVTTTNSFYSSSKYQVKIFDSGKLVGRDHTITITPRNIGPRAGYFTVDALLVYTKALVGPARFGPDCYNSQCHNGTTQYGVYMTDKSLNHKTNPWPQNTSHWASIAQTQTLATSKGNVACGVCHVSIMQAEHDTYQKPSTSDDNWVGGDRCTACHGGVSFTIPKTWTGTYNLTCSSGTCHTGARLQHSNETTAHRYAPGDGCSNSGAGCHNSSTSTTLHANFASCTTICHTGNTAAAYPVNPACSGVGSCHDLYQPEAHKTIDAVSETSHSVAPSSTFTAYQAAGPDGTVYAGSRPCTECHTFKLMTAHSNVSTGGSAARLDGVISCLECHSNTSLAATTTVKTNWATRKCVQCHDFGAARTHDASSSAHNVSAGACAGTVGCHPSQNLLDIHVALPASGCASVDTTSFNRGCHVSLDSRPAITQCGTLTAGCHLEKTTANHGGGAHEASNLSDYSEAVDTNGAGCTMSGAGCHETTRGILPFHPNSGCQAGSCHASSSKLSGTNTFECVSCHDGFGIGTGDPDTPDRVALYNNFDAAGGGHYGVTTHTPAAAAVTTVIRAQGGLAGAACSDCHSGQLREQHTGLASGQTTAGVNVSCAECHNDTGMPSATQVNANWSNNLCTDCHALAGGGKYRQHESSAPASIMGTSPVYGCGNTGTNCHASADLHILHKNSQATATGCNLTGCHNFGVQAHRPSERSCEAAGCHSGYTNVAHGARTGNEPTHTATSLQSNDTSWSVTCGSCHWMELSREHTATYSGMTNGGCTQCHNNAGSTTAIQGNWATRNSTTACAACHGVGSIGRAHTMASLSGTHTIAAQPAGCGGTGAGCHNTGNISALGTATGGIHNSCLRCHNKAPTGDDMAYNPNLKTCGSGQSCHNGGTWTATIHTLGGTPGDDTTHTATNNWSAYTGALDATSVTRGCTGCHSNTLRSAHITMSVSPALTCDTCHNHGQVAGQLTTVSAIVKADWNNNQCNACHTAMHETINTSHTANAADTACANSGAGCHQVSDIAQLHRLAPTGGTGGCGVCHTTANKPVGTRECAASGCHAGESPLDPNHYTGTETSHTAATASLDSSVTSAGVTGLYDVDCQMCHQGNVSLEHTVTQGETAGGVNISCLECHNDPNGLFPNSPATVKNNWPAPRGCNNCHTTKSVEHSSALAGGTAGLHDFTNTGNTSWNTSNTACVGGGCHASFLARGGVANVALSHSFASTGTGPTRYSCQVCHINADTAEGGVVLARSTCTTVACHPDRKAAHGDANHDASRTVGSIADASTSETYAIGSNFGCFAGCHYRNVQQEHGPLSMTISGVATSGAGRRMFGGTGGTNGCGVCHASGAYGTAGTYSTRQDVVDAYNGGDFRCQSCHTGLASGVPTAPHAAFNTSAGIVTTFGAPPVGTVEEFKNWTYGGGHNAGGVFFPKTFAGTAPWGGTFLSGVGGNVGDPIESTLNFQAGWTATSRVLCSDCHTFTAGVNGPQGATVPYGMSARWRLGSGAGNWQPGDWAKGLVRWPTNDTAGGVLTAAQIGPCGACHNGLGTGAFHGGNNGHDAGTTATLANKPCIACHIRIPHAWKRPRLLRRTLGGNITYTDPVYGSVTASIDSTAYAIRNMDGLVGFSAVGITGSSDCAENFCNGSNTGRHNPTGPSAGFWP